MSSYPQKLQELIDDFEFITTREERTEYLIELADRFGAAKVPPEIATQPYDESFRVQACESDAFVWAVEQPDGTLTYYFDVLNPQGLSAMAVGVILHETCSGAPLEQVAGINAEVVYKFFGREISMGKGRGLMGIINTVAHEARKRLG